MKKKKVKEKKYNHFEKLLFVMTFILVLFTPIMSIYAKSTLSKVNYEVETKKDEISTQTKSNESLQMKINELASLENIEAIAKQQGLSYTGDSVKTIDDSK